MADAERNPAPGPPLTPGHLRPDVGGFLFAPSSLYPRPAAFLVDHRGRTLHTWSNPRDQPRPEDNPPKNLRGWNHVEVDGSGHLYAVVPLRSLLKLTPDSEVVWAADIAAHHDLALDCEGNVRALTEEPRLVMVEGITTVILDNLVTRLDRDGLVVDEVSLHDVLRSDPVLRSRVDGVTVGRAAEFRARGWPAPAEQVAPLVLQRTRHTLRTKSQGGERRRTLSRLRSLPGSPCDVMHTNTLELLDDHPSGLWRSGDALVCLRDLDTVAVVDLEQRAVRWHWGAGVLSGPHQPSALSDGRVLLFDNGVAHGRSRLLVVDPTTDEIVWSWSARPPGSFYCPLAGGCEVLPDGDILVTDSTAGAAFALDGDGDGDVVWRLTLPVNVYGRDRGRVSIYRMTAVAHAVVSLLLGTTSRDTPTRRPRCG